LTCRYQSTSKANLELPDNITSRNDRGAILICEDGPVENYIRPGAGSASERPPAGR
jgi:hypothetical protein